MGILQIQDWGIDHHTFLYPISNKQALKNENLPDMSTPLPTLPINPHQNTAHSKHSRLCPHPEGIKTFCWYRWNRLEPLFYLRHCFTNELN